MSRPGRDGGGASAPSFKSGVLWPPGDCFLTAGWDEPGATCYGVFARSHEDGRTVAAFVEIDRSGPGVMDARLLTLERAEMLLNECIQVSEASGDLAFQGAPPAIVAGVLLDAATHGSRSVPENWSRVTSLLAGINADTPDTPFGADPPPPPRSGLLDRLFRMLG